MRIIFVVVTFIMLNLAFYGSLILWTYNRRWGQLLDAGIVVALLILLMGLLVNSRLTMWRRHPAEHVKDERLGHDKPNMNEEKRSSWQQIHGQE